MEPVVLHMSDIIRLIDETRSLERCYSHDCAFQAAGACCALRGRLIEGGVCQHYNNKVTQAELWPHLFKEPKAQE